MVPARVSALMKRQTWRRLLRASAFVELDPDNLAPPSYHTMPVGNHHAVPAVGEASAEVAQRGVNRAEVDHTHTGSRVVRQLRVSLRVKETKARLESLCDA